MGADKRNTEEGFLDFCRKAKDSFLVCCKWLSVTLIVCWEIVRNYALMVWDYCKIKLEFNKLGQEAYTQWKKHKTFSLESNFVKIKEFEKSIDGYDSLLKKFIKKLNVLFDFNDSQIPSPNIKTKSVEAVKTNPESVKQVKKISKPETVKPAKKSSVAKKTVTKKTTVTAKKTTTKKSQKSEKKPQKTTKKS